jgi:hypothetical protein
MIMKNILATENTEITERYGLVFSVCSVNSVANRF